MKKLKLEAIEVQSFLTSTCLKHQQTLKGGDGDTNDSVINCTVQGGPVGDKTIDTNTNPLLKSLFIRDCLRM